MANIASLSNKMDELLQLIVISTICIQGRGGHREYWGNMLPWQTSTLCQIKWMSYRH